MYQNTLSSESGAEKNKTPRQDHGGDEFPFTASPGASNFLKRGAQPVLVTIQVTSLSRSLTS